jgi:hypothetical protein
MDRRVCEQPSVADVAAVEGPPLRDPQTLLMKVED